MIFSAHENEIFVPLLNSSVRASSEKNAAMLRQQIKTEPPPTMKLITLLAVVAGFAVLTPATSQARDYHGSSNRSYSHNCGSCRTPIYRQRVVVGHDRHGCPVYGYRTVSHSCRSSYGHSSHGHSSHGHSGSRGGISLPGFFFGFGR